MRYYILGEAYKPQGKHEESHLTDRERCCACLVAAAAFGANCGSEFPIWGVCPIAISVMQVDDRFALSGYYHYTTHCPNRTNKF